MKVNLRMKCSNCGFWNRIPAEKMFMEQPCQDPKVKVFIPIYEPLKMVKCKKCGKTLAEPKTLIIRTQQRSASA